MYVQRNIEVLSLNHCYSGKSKRVTYSKRVFVALGTLHAMRLRHIFICRLSGSTVFFYLISQTAQFLKRITDT